MKRQGFGRIQKITFSLVAETRVGFPAVTASETVVSLARGLNVRVLWGIPDCQLIMRVFRDKILFLIENNKTLLT